MKPKRVKSRLSTTNNESLERLLLSSLTKTQVQAVTSPKRRLLVVAGAGSGKTEVMARRIAWWIGVDQVEKRRIVAFTFTERAAEEMKYRIRFWLSKIKPADQETSLGGMYVGTIHGYCLAKLREYWPDDYHNYDILDESARTALILRGFNSLLGLRSLQNAIGQGRYATVESFAETYDQLHEHSNFEIELPIGEPPHELGEVESEWCKEARLLTVVGDTDAARAFARSAARYYSYLRCRRFLDFSTSQSEFVRRLGENDASPQILEREDVHLVVDEVQDINPVQHEIIQLLIGNSGRLTAVGDHRQSIYGFRGARVEIIADLWEKFNQDNDAQVVDLEENFRSTPRLIDLANRWAATIGEVGAMTTTPMKHGNRLRRDQHASHLALVKFDDRQHEATWIADAVRILVPSELKGALHDKRDGTSRGLTLSDIAVLVRSSTDVRAYMQALESAGIPSVVRAGPDLFSQPEVLLFISALAITAGCDEFLGSPQNSKSLPQRIQRVLGCPPTPQGVLRESARVLRGTGLAFDRDIEERLLLVSQAIRKRLAINQSLSPSQGKVIRTPSLRAFLTSRHELRRVFPQQIYQMLLAEAEIGNWDACEGRGQSALFHLGALSGLITGIETPGWTSVNDYRWQIIGLCQYGAEEGRTEEQPLMVQPDAVSISTIHAAKGLEFAAVFLADVNAQRFPSSKARQTHRFPLSGQILQEIDVASLSDNANYDGERRLMYVALTRSERFLFVSHSGNRTSRFINEIRNHFESAQGIVTDDPAELLAQLKYAPKEHQRDVRIATSFSDLRYYLECPHDFYLRKVLGFSPTIDQAFGYGRAVHNLMRAIHADPKKWAALVTDPVALTGELRRLVERGLFYLRYTTGEPADNMRDKGVRIAASYVNRYVEELKTLIFEPEKEFETLVEYEDGSGGALISGAIDIVRQDDPPRVTLIDFKSGDPGSDSHQKLDESQMRLQVALYAIAAKKELEYEPEKGLVRYLDPQDLTKAELQVPLDHETLVAAQKTVSETAKTIRNRKFLSGPVARPDANSRCSVCDFKEFCGMPIAIEYRSARRHE